MSAAEEVKSVQFLVDIAHSPSDTPLTDGQEFKFRDGKEDEDERTRPSRVAPADFARDLERVARQMDEALADATYKLYGHGPAAPKEQNALDAWRAFEERYK